MSIAGRVDDIDEKVETVRRMVERFSREDVEMSVGFVNSATLKAAERRIDEAMDVCIQLHRHLKVCASAA